MAIRKKLRPANQINPVAKKNNYPKTVAELKKKYRHLPLHFLFGIEKEIDFQCPTLDEYLEQLEEVKTALEKIRKSSNLEMAKIHAATALHAMDEIPSGIDQLTRGNFEKLRKTSESWKQLAITAMNESKDPEKFIKI